MAVAVDLKGRRVATREGRSYPYEHLLSSLPLPDLCRMSSDRELAAYADRLTWGATLCLNLGIRGAVPEALEGVHWVYVADRDIPFYRVGCYSNISRGTCAAGCHSLYVEVGADGAAVDRADLARHVLPDALEALAGLGWVDPGRVVCASLNAIACAYVHLTEEREALLEGLAGRLREDGVHLIGRYGRWDYTSMEDCILTAVRAAGELPP
ncbi:MAG: hypothetical protein HY900_26845 [Deltaproteobacteria bacterium]|nr:hypothetical protein [Deltaproteobacteria bacterium]